MEKTLREKSWDSITHLLIVSNELEHVSKLLDQKDNIENIWSADGIRAKIQRSIDDVRRAIIVLAQIEQEMRKHEKRQETRPNQETSPNTESRREELRKNVIAGGFDSIHQLRKALNSKR